MADENTEHTDSEDQKALPQKSTNLATIKVILDFISKSFYPGIAIAVLVLLWTPLSSIDISSLILRLQSIKAGDYELAFNQAQDVGAEIAPLNGRMEEFERTIASLKAALKEIQDETKITPPQQNTQEINEQKKFVSNSKYTVLVFHRKESRRPANKITQALLKDGYVSSDTETDFSELKKVTPKPNLIFITYTSDGQQVLDNVKAVVRSVAPDAEVKVNPRPISLRRGDVQILTF